MCPVRLKPFLWAARPVASPFGRWRLRARPPAAKRALDGPNGQALAAFLVPTERFFCPAGGNSLQLSKERAPCSEPGRPLRALGKVTTRMRQPDEQATDGCRPAPSGEAPVPAASALQGWGSGRNPV